jgi:hypothetical protein
LIDQPIQMLVALLVIAVMVALLRLTSGRRRRPSTRLPARLGWIVLRLFFWVVILMMVLVAVEATRFVQANICIEIDPVIDWCPDGELSGEGP